ncbi:MAG: hypothetical protein EZS28_028026 [Streblomastix strix]|uniref:Uncharacterized protein n=1 Tax=Streblomastix strix TaxID=222440 RepID=A0A5J4V320_9EUKA|nr:MAG: hypothetical protein EZS28_028026 [Streblomastix strix]
MPESVQITQPLLPATPQQQLQMQGQQPLQQFFQYSGQPMQYPISPTQFPTIPSLNPFLPTMNPQQTQISEPQLPCNETVRDQQISIQPSQQTEQAAIQTVERPRQSATTTRSMYNMLISPIPAYPQQQTSRIPLLLYTIERNQQQRQSQRSISPAHKRVDQSEEDDFPDEIISGIIMPHLPPHKTIEKAQRTWQDRGYDFVRDSNMIQYKNSKQQIKLTSQNPFIFRDWSEFWSYAGFSLEQINISYYILKQFKSQSPLDKSRRNEAVKNYEREKEKAIDNRKAMKNRGEDEVIFDTQSKKKQNSSSNSNCSNSGSRCSKQIFDDWTRKGNSITQ